MLAQNIHQLAARIPPEVEVEWAPRDLLTAHCKADVAAWLAASVPSSTSPLELDDATLLLTRKEHLRRRTRDLIPPCAAILRPGLTRAEEVALRRIRVGVALTPAVTRKWPHFRYPFVNHGCQVCHRGDAIADRHHLLWSCLALRPTRMRHLAATGIRVVDASAYTGWIYGYHYRSLLDFIYEGNIFIFI